MFFSSSLPPSLSFQSLSGSTGSHWTPCPSLAQVCSQQLGQDVSMLCRMDAGSAHPRDAETPGESNLVLFSLLTRARGGGHTLPKPTCSLLWAELHHPLPAGKELPYLCREGEQGRPAYQRSVDYQQLISLLGGQKTLSRRVLRQCERLIRSSSAS